MYKAFKFRLYPNNKQKELINKTFGCARYVYNYYLDKMKNNGYFTAYTNIKDYTSKLKYDAPFLEELDRDLNASINIMFEGLKLYMRNSIKI